MFRYIKLLIGSPLRCSSPMRSPCSSWSRDCPVHVYLLSKNCWTALCGKLVSKESLFLRLNPSHTFRRHRQGPFVLCYLVGRSVVPNLNLDSKSESSHPRTTFSLLASRRSRRFIFLPPPVWTYPIRCGFWIKIQIKKCSFYLFFFCQLSIFFVPLEILSDTKKSWLWPDFKCHLHKVVILRELLFGTESHWRVICMEEKWYARSRVRVWFLWVLKESSIIAPKDNLPFQRF